MRWFKGFYPFQWPRSTRLRQAATSATSSLSVCLPAGRCSRPWCAPGSPTVSSPPCCPGARTSTSPCRWGGHPTKRQGDISARDSSEKRSLKRWKQNKKLMLSTKTLEFVLRIHKGLMLYLRYWPLTCGVPSDFSASCSEIQFLYRIGWIGCVPGVLLNHVANSA